MYMLLIERTFRNIHNVHHSNDPILRHNIYTNCP